MIKTMLIGWMYIFGVGTAIGSFLNVVIDRTPLNQSILTGRSYCDYCKKELKWYELIPLLSFIIQRGKSHCEKKLSWQYPLVELLTGLMTLFLFNYYLTHALSPLVWVLLCIFTYAMFAIAIIDFKDGIIPDRILAFLVGIYYFFQLILWLSATDQTRIFSDPLWVHTITGLAAASIFILIIKLSTWVFGKEGMGWGDVKLAFVIGLYLSYQRTIMGLYLAFLSGGGIALIMLLVHKRKFGQTIPFGPFMVLGAVIALFFYSEILRLYLTLLG